ncbi:MAG: hypothetical protein ACR2PR_03565, partial [Pseudohongiellaceae bacterium]
MSNEAINPFQQFKDDGGTILARGTIEFFENGQEVTQKTLITGDNPYTLDDFGRTRGDVQYEGLATIVITNAAGLRIRRVDDVVPSSDGNTGNITVYEPSVAAMVSDESLVVGDVVRTAAYFANENLGGARYEIVAAGTGTPDNYLFHGLGNGLQAKLLDREKRNSFLYAGARGDGSDDTTAMQAVINQGGDVKVEGGFTFAATNLTIPGNVRFIGSGTMQQIPGSSGDLFQITTTAVTSVKFKGVTLDGNQNNGNAGNS